MIAKEILPRATVFDTTVQTEAAVNGSKDAKNVSTPTLFSLTGKTTISMSFTTSKIYYF